jgi:hypothetical protein
VEVRVALDTDRLTDLLRGDRALAERLAECEEVWVPLIILAEMAKPTVAVPLPDRETAEQYARLFVQLKRAGTPIPDNDLWIAALTLQHDLLLITHDRHFACIPQLLRE